MFTRWLWCNVIFAYWNLLLSWRHKRGADDILGIHRTSFFRTQNISEISFECHLFNLTMPEDIRMWSSAMIHQKADFNWKNANKKSINSCWAKRRDIHAGNHLTMLESKVAKPSSCKLSWLAQKARRCVMGKWSWYLSIMLVSWRWLPAMLGRFCDRY